MPVPQGKSTELESIFLRFGRSPNPLTIHLQDKASVLAASCCFCDSDHVVPRVLQPQVRQPHGAVVEGLHSAAVVLRDVGVPPRLPGPYGAAHRS